MDLNEFLRSLGIDVFAETAPVALAAFNLGFGSEETSPTITIYDNNGNFREEIPNPDYAEQLMPFSAFSFFEPLLPAQNNTGAGGIADIVFVIDTTGSMGGIINNVRNNVNLFASMLVDEYNIDANFALVEFRDILADGMDSTRVHTNGHSNWFTTVSGLHSALGGLSVGGGGDWPETPIDGLEMARRLDFRTNAAQFIVLVTDADYHVDNRYGISGMAEMSSLFSESDMIVSVISADWYHDLYSPLFATTGGLFANIYGNFSSTLIELAAMIGEATNDGYWVLLSNYEPVRLNGPLHENHDTDGDGILDRDELGEMIQRDMTPFIEALRASRGIVSAHSMVQSISSMNNYTGTDTHVETWQFYSNPTRADTDGDGMPDNLDPEPRIPHDPRFIFVRNATYRPPNSEVSNNQLLSEDRYADETLSWYDLRARYILTSIQSRAQLTTVGGMAFDYPNAVRGLGHFLQNTGDNLSISIRHLLDTDNGRDNFNINMDAFLRASEQMVLDGMTRNISTIDQGYRDDRFWATLYPFERRLRANVLPSQSNERDWFFFVNNATAAMTGSVSRDGDNFTATINYFLDDMYDWEPGSTDSGGIVLDGEMALLHAYGWAQEYRVDGHIRGIEIRWSRGQRFGVGVIVGEPVLVLPSR
jgi:hypothetical protein